MKNQLPIFAKIWEQEINWKPTEKHLDQWEELYQEIILINNQVNLTRIVKPEEFWEKHLWDSIAGVVGLPFFQYSRKMKVIDIGTGGGFPGLPINIVFPIWDFTLLDSRRKKIEVVNFLLKILELETSWALTGRVEKIAHDSRFRGKYDIALIRAVGESSTCSEYILPFLNIGGIGVLYRGNWSIQEEQLLKVALKRLGGKLILVKESKTPLTKSVRHFVYVQKTHLTPKCFPRDIGVPKSNPL